MLVFQEGFPISRIQFILQRDMCLQTHIHLICPLPQLAIVKSLNQTLKLCRVWFTPGKCCKSNDSKIRLSNQNFLLYVNNNKKESQLYLRKQPTLYEVNLNQRDSKGILENKKSVLCQNHGGRRIAQIPCMCLEYFEITVLKHQGNCYKFLSLSPKITNGKIMRYIVLKIKAKKQ